MKINCITEVALAVHDLDAAVAQLCAVFEARPGPVQDFPAYAMRFCMVRVGAVDFEVMAPTGEGVIARFLAQRGEGIHHIAFAVDDVLREQRRLERLGLRFADAEPRSAEMRVHDFAGQLHEGANRFTFAKPSSFLGVLLELVQYGPGFELPAHAKPTD